MVGQPCSFDMSDRLRELSAKGDNLERIAALVDFQQFRPELEQAVPRSDGSKGGRPAFDHVLIFKVLLLAPCPRSAERGRIGAFGNFDRSPGGRRLEKRAFLRKG